jgi:hypothetical protein
MFIDFFQEPLVLNSMNMVFNMVWSKVEQEEKEEAGNDDAVNLKLLCSVSVSLMLVSFCSLGV